MTTQSERRPGWPEIIVGLIGIAIFGIGLAFFVVQLPLDPVAIGLIMTALSGVGGLAGFFFAYFLRLREWGAFGIRQTTMKWLLIGVGAGVFAFIAKSLSILLYVALTGDNSNMQAVYGQGGSGGAWSLVLATLLLAVLTPLGEEFLFRGVVTSALLKYGALVGVVGGAVIFALFHGINPVFPAALVTGLIAGEVFRRSGSIWPAVMVHSVVNLPTVPALVLAGATQ
ncbi:MAG: type II CAAX endopeptidase family protein [Candidatus Devosia phytovorans]|uniref:Type II CAAX endopeptidase family protein n=1 Tax=Candidatus Devosia phytovorans TaxID=3121372 RepID=A0AAJ6B0S9_9HYPH|nr:type II CAAX endopeptidase family protein [Devosia sp.]WEK06035.1 MAG: type II CAAX endopeptidase family protein [Devosia sp.]